MKGKSMVLGGLALAMVLACCPWAQAALGGSADSIGADRAALQAVQRAAVARAGFTVQEVVTDATVVREYLSPSGVVFGIAWNGYVHPDLSQLLGSYWDEFSTANRKAERNFGRRRQRLATEHLVLERWGHMRKLQGRAYLPSLVPEGVSTDDIK